MANTRQFIGREEAESRKRCGDRKRRRRRRRSTGG